jgi:uncharacterized membrane protein
MRFVHFLTGLSAVGHKKASYFAPWTTARISIATFIYLIFPLKGQLYENLIVWFILWLVTYCFFAQNLHCGPEIRIRQWFPALGHSEELVK